MRVWEVGVYDCENSSTICICATKELALREMFKKRDELIKEWKESDISNEELEKKYCAEPNNMWKNMIKALSHDNYEEWNNYPHQVPWIHESTIIDE